MKRGIGTALLVILIVATASQLELGFSAQTTPSTTPVIKPTLIISPALTSIPSDGKQHPAFFISTENGAGKPYLLPSSLNVTVSCSDERVLTIPHQVTIPANLYYIVVNASSTIQDQKTVEVSVSEPGFISSKININVEPPAGTPKALKVTLLPDILIPEKGAYSEVVVTIVDTYGNPAMARSDLSVTLSSSNLQIADISPRTLQIPKGSFSAKAHVVSNGFVGTAIITASAQDLKTDSATIKISGAKPEKLSIWTQASFLENDSGIVFVGVVDNNLKPAKTPVSVTVHLYSTNTSVCTVPPSVTIGEEKWMTTALITSIKTGTATVYAVADNIASMSLNIKVLKAGTLPPVAVKVYSMASYLPADDSKEKYIAIQTVDAKGNPARCSTSTTISVFSSYHDILDSQSSIIMNSTDSVNYASATPKSAGVVKITAGSTNLSSSDATINVYSPQATTVGIISSPIPAGGEAEACLIISSSGVPAPAPQDTLVQISSSDTQIAGSDTSTTLPNKNYYTIFKIIGVTPGQFSLTAQGSGFPSTSVNLQVYEVRPSLFKIAYVKPLAHVGFPIVIQSVSSQGVPVVSDEPILINMASSNTTVLTLPTNSTIPAESSDVLTSGQGFNQGKMTLTISSGGFNSLNADLTAQSMKGGIQLTSVDKSTTGGTTGVTVEVTLEGKPVVGTTVKWKGVGLYATSTVTDSKGKSNNMLKVKEGSNIVEADVNVPGLGKLAAQKTITGETIYNLEVTSNIGIPIDGSGSYPEGSQAKITAPLTIDVTGILNLLGARQTFKGWFGASNSTNNTVRLVFAGDQTNLSLLAQYDTDYMGVIIRLGIFTAGLVFLFIGVLLWRRRSG